MTITELIEKHADNIPMGKACGHNDCPDLDCEMEKDHKTGYREFAVELLELVRVEGDLLTESDDGPCNLHHIAIDKALEELRK